MPGYISAAMSTQLIENTVKLAIRNYRKTSRREIKRLKADFEEMVRKYDAERNLTRGLTKSAVSMSRKLEHLSDEIVRYDTRLEETFAELKTSEDNNTWVNAKLMNVEEDLEKQKTITADFKAIAENAVKDFNRAVEILEQVNS